MENIRRFDPADLEMIEGFEMVLEGLKRLPMDVRMSITIDDLTELYIYNLDEDVSETFHIHLHHECEHCTKVANMECSHGNKRLVFDLMDSLNRGYDASFVDYLFSHAEEVEVE